jgi:hypothetical protein
LVKELNDVPIAGCFFLDSSVILSEILGDNHARMAKFKEDVKNHSLSCFFSDSVVRECEDKINKTINFLEFVLKDIIIKYLEGIMMEPRDLSTSEISNEDLRTLQYAFLTVNHATRDFDLLEDPFQAIEEWVIEKLEKEVEKPKKGFVSDFILLITAKILEAITKLNSDLENYLEFENGFFNKQSEQPDEAIVKLLTTNQGKYTIQKQDALNISVVSTYQNRTKMKAVFLTFDYFSILLKWETLQDRNPELMKIDCCDPIYGLSFLRN